MPYAPGVSDQSGQILAQGVNGTLQQYAQDMLRMQENEQKRRAAAGQIQGLLASDPALAAKADSGLVQKLSAGKATLADTMELLGSLSAVKSHQDEMLAAKLKEAQMQHLGQQNALLTQQVATMQAAEAARQRNTSAVGGAIAGPWADNTPAAVINRAASKGADAQTLDTLSQMSERVAQANARGNPQGMMFPNIQSLEAKFPAAQYDYQMVEDPRTGAVTVPKVSPRAPSNQPNQFKGAMDESLGKQVAGIIERVPDYNNTIEQVQRARAAMEAGATTGGLAGAKLAVKQGINGIFGTNVIDTADTELAKKSFADMALSAASRMKTQGQITEQERKLLADTVAQMGDSPQAIAYITNYMEAVAQRNLGKAQALQQLRDQGIDQPGQYSRVLTNWEKDNPIDLAAIGAAPAPKPKGAAAAPAALPPGWSIRN